ncbi:hypothetical protein HC251_24195 [Iamia sp. SCSIO 61187]|uniref:hypothetical protein n=1 Tax=Iamia sp. SCSIO 61187 TaxID=2722752 RepID=UPI001C626190|nr:hypothetical protein [Iamia sp. SCSIO 61187]QYG95224.1 hypothetical protein HC251_24195 [Iamia sp. SCSIO 61187]
MDGAEVVRVGERPAVRLVPEAGRVVVRAMFGRPDVGVDLSAHPAAVVACLDHAASEGRTSLAAVGHDVRRSLGRVASRCDGWAPQDDGLGLLGHLGGAALPLLGATYDAGCTPLAEVPRWAVPIVACRRAGDGARRAFGASATRPTVGAMARALAGEGSGPRPPGLAALALAVAGRTVLDGDRIVALLDELTWSGPPHRTLTVDEVAAVRPVVGRLGPVRARRLLAEAGTTASGIDDLVALSRIWPDVEPRLEGRLPSGLVGLFDHCRSLVRTAPPAPSPPVRRRRARRPPARTTETEAIAARADPALPAAGPDAGNGDRSPRLFAAEPLPSAPTATPRAVVRPTPHGRFTERMVVAPAATAPVVPATALPMPSWAAAVDGSERAGVTLVLPRTVRDLERWGRLLRSCVGTFGPAVVEGSATLVGLFAGSRLVGCLHLDPTPQVVQMLGLANRPLDRDVRRAVLTLLEDEEVLSRTLPVNRRWFATLD